jgi:hypothetical protein
MKSVHKDSRCDDPISNKAHAEYKSEVLPSDRVAGVCVCGGGGFAWSSLN